MDDWSSERIRSATAERATPLDPFQEDGEFVAAETRDGVLVAHGAANALGHLAQDLVSRVVSEDIIDLLEPVPDR